MHYDGGTMETYARMMASLDANIGRVLARLGELGMAEDTIVVFTSDNGGERFSDTWPFTGRKTELLEGGLRIPAIVRWPGVVVPGTRSEAQIISMDWLPTFVAAGGGALDPDYPPDGIDIAPALRGGALPERTLFWRFGNKNQKAARRGDLKYLSINDNEFLFDVSQDPLERANLKARLPERFAELKAAWDAWDAGMLHDPTAVSAGASPAQVPDRFAPAPPRRRRRIRIRLPTPSAAQHLARKRGGVAALLNPPGSRGRCRAERGGGASLSRQPFRLASPPRRSAAPSSRISTAISSAGAAIISRIVCSGSEVPSASPPASGNTMPPMRPAPPAQPILLLRISGG